MNAPRMMNTLTYTRPGSDIEWRKVQPGWYEATIDHYTWRIVQGGSKSWEIYEFSADGRIDHGDAGSLGDAKLWVGVLLRRRSR